MAMLGGNYRKCQGFDSKELLPSKNKCEVLRSDVCNRVGIQIR